ncbi:MAG: glycosyltransferase family 39 protein [Deltaproteobacteria bacterium]|nr:glycosyltransferase family 39 protein [Deltaproteobacteria bacterium]MCL5277787.1 glycosyltransferase family 39 protein [Deltaproteobacteria bacterium]
MKRRTAAYIAILAAFIFNIYYMKTAHLLLSPDEAYYWDWARHPSLSYLDMGPMIAWINMLMVRVFGSTAFALRMGANIFSAITAMVFFEIGDRFFSGTTALLATILYLLNPLVSAGSFIETYYVPQILLMTILLFLLFELNEAQKPRLWYLIGLVLGLGILSHHMFFFFSLEVVLFVLISDRNRHWLSRKEPYLGAVITVITASPVFVWNLSHGLGMFRRALSLLPGHYNPWFVFSNFFFGDMGLLTPFVFVLLLYVMLYSVKRGMFRHDERFNVILATSLPTFVFISFLAFKGRAEVNWPAAGFIAPFIGGVYLLEGAYKSGHKRFAVLSFVLMFVTTLPIVYFEHYPNWIVEKLRLPPKNQFTARLRGWDRLAHEVERLSRPGDIVGATDYGVTAELAFYLKGQPEVYYLKVNETSKNAYWFFQDRRVLRGKDVIIVDRGSGDLNPVTRSLFSHVDRLGVFNFTDGASGTPWASFTIYRGYDYQGGASWTR